MKCRIRDLSRNVGKVHAKDLFLKHPRLVKSAHIYTTIA